MIFNPMMKVDVGILLVIAVDLGSTKIAAAIFALQQESE